MGGLRKIAIALGIYVILGIIFSLLLLMGFYSIHTNFIIVILLWFFQPIFYVVNILYHIWLF